MGEPRGDLAALTVLVEELRADREALDRHAETVRHALAGVPWAADSAVLSVVAVAVHHFYGATETIFERVARTFEGPPDQLAAEDVLRAHELLSEDLVAFEGALSASIATGRS